MLWVFLAYFKSLACHIRTIPEYDKLRIEKAASGRKRLLNFLTEARN